MERGRGRARRGGRRPHRGRGDHRGAPRHHTAEARDAGDAQEAAEDDERPQAAFSRRKVLSNWDRYEAAEKEEAAGEEVSQRGADYHVLLSSAGGWCSQLRLAEEKDWGAAGGGAGSLDGEALVSALRGLPLHLRLNVEAEAVPEESVPRELPQVTGRGDTAGGATYLHYTTLRATYPQQPSLGATYPQHPSLGANPSSLNVTDSFLGANASSVGATYPHHPSMGVTHPSPGAKSSSMVLTHPLGVNSTSMGANPSSRNVINAHHPSPGENPSSMVPSHPTLGAKPSSTGATHPHHPSMGANPSSLEVTNPSGATHPTCPYLGENPSSMGLTHSSTGVNVQTRGAKANPAPPGLDEELDFLLTLEAPVAHIVEAPDQTRPKEPPTSAAVTEDDGKSAEKSKAVTAEDLEDWLDSMID